MAQEHYKTLSTNESTYEWKIVLDTNEDIDDTYLNTEAEKGWILWVYINSRQGRFKDRYYFRRLKAKNQ